MLLSAAEYGNDEAIRSIIDGGRVPDVSDEEGSTPLMYAAANGRESLVRLLLQVPTRYVCTLASGTTILITSFSLLHLIMCGYRNLTPFSLSC